MIIPLLISISLIGLLLLTMLYWRLREIDRSCLLKRHRTREAGLCDLLNYAAVVSDGVVIGKNGALIAAWEYTGADSASSSDEGRDIVSVRMNQALARLGNGWMLHVDAIRTPVAVYSARETSHFPDCVSAAIDEERRAYFQEHGSAYESKFVLCVSYLPPGRAVRKLSEIIFDDDSPQVNEAQAALNMLEVFERELRGLENRLSSSFKLRRLKGRKEVTQTGQEIVYDELLSHLQYCITGIRQPVALPHSPVYLDGVLGGQEMWGGVMPRIGRKFLQVVAIEGFPEDSCAGILSSLGELRSGYRWSSRFIFLESWEALSHIEQFRRKWQGQVIPFLAQVFNFRTENINHDAAGMVDDAIEAKVGISGGMVSAGYYTANLLFFGEDRSQVETSARAAEKAINNLGFTARVETINTMDAWLGSLPGHGTENVRRPLINTLNLADLLPVSSIWTGEPEAPCPFYPPSSPPLFYAVTTGSTPFRGNLHVRDLGSSLIFGPVGTGKSTFLAFLVASFRRYPGMSVFAFDKGMSLYTLCKATAGAHYVIGGEDDQLAFCPLQYLESRSARAWAVDWIDQILALNGKPATPEQRNDIARSLEIMAREPAHRTLSAFCHIVQDNSIRTVLQEYTVAGSQGVLFDAESDTLTGFESFTVFEIEDLMNLGERYALPVLWNLFRRIESALDGQPAALLIDEAWLALGHALFREKIREWLKTMRKANCAVVLATQSLSDAARSGILDVLDEGTSTKVFLPNLSARAEDAAALYRRFGLNDREIEILAGAIPKREYYMVSEKGRRLISLELGPLALAFLGVSDKDSVAAVRKYYEEFGEQWVSEWLRRRGLNPSEYFGQAERREFATC
jgi:type IV secretion system protein VirB4